MFDENEEDIQEDVPKTSFNKVAVRKPWKDEPQDETITILADKQKAREEMRCKECGSIKQQRKEGQGKFRWVCVPCKTRKRTESDRKRRNETRST